jgi:hypothetical protein
VDYPNLKLIKEIDLLWDPVYPYLAKQISELYARQGGDILEVGPFCGVIFNLRSIQRGDSFHIASFPPGMNEFFREMAKKKNLEGKVEIIESDPGLKNIAEESFDLVVFRGALFFPSLFQVDFAAIVRVLKRHGIAFVGGGFGKDTPDHLIKDVAKRSRELNLRIGKVEVNEDDLINKINILKIEFHVISEGGLWVLMRK